MTILGTLKLAGAAVVGLAIGLAAAILYGCFFALPDAREAGRLEQRAIHDADREKAEAVAVAQARATQSRIEAIEAGYLQREADRSAQLVALEQALQDKPDDPPPTGSAACRVLIPRRVSDQLDRIGRAAGPALPAKPDAGVPAGR
ncbi:hypothetical protein [Aureimonas sp. AU40]|uniref:hypothetical protein n=1 Tax=Aureimonas sp. AU40 TaxID=1637747 RepID=UPI0007859C9D|nr:hypothetical protein [Aureimonas sp. AU40]